MATRERLRPEGSYTTRLFEGGVRRIAQKVGEEGVETALAAVAEDDNALLGEAADLAAWRGAEEINSLSPGGPQVAGEGDWTVVYNGELQPLAPGALNRTVRVVAVDKLADVMPLLTPHRAFLQTVGVAAAPRELFELAEQLGRAGVTRICALGQMTSPEAGWHHDGRCSLLDMVQMVDIDSSAEAAAENLAPYVD